MKEHSRPCYVLATKIITTKRKDPTKGQTYKSTKWTDPTKVKLTSPQSGRIPPRVELTSPQSGRTQPGSNLQVHKVDGSHQGSTRFTKWTAPTRAKLIQVQKVDGPTKGQTYTTPKRGRTLPTFKTPIHIMDGPNQFIKLYKSTKWTAIRGHDHIPRNGRT